MNKIRVRIRLSEEMVNAIKEIAERDHRTEAEEIRWILHQYLLDKERQYYRPKGRISLKYIHQVDKK